MSFRLLALTPKGIFFDKNVEEAYIPTPNGPLGIFPNYTRARFALAPSGVLKVKESGKEKYYAIFGGVVRVDSNQTMILTEEIEDGLSIDMARAIAARDRAQDLLSNKEMGADIDRARAALNRALTRIDVKSLDEGGRKS
ncbi:MAG: ATP synthase epsilon chain [Tenericutes bacterium ADurb.BinA155]|jgi:F-type H+-transporting ATPase subunit epsilon|nr:MAG: ATP synthase epsilon chain [Tenericutes bacterium ADurb.BinA155]